MKGKLRTVTRAMAVGAIFSAVVFGFGLSAAQAQVDPGQPSYRTLVSEVQALQQQVATLQSALAAVQANKALALGDYVTVDPNDEKGLKGPNVIFHGANFHIVSGSGDTVDSTGLGNLVIGYDQDSENSESCLFAQNVDIDAARTGSHNLIVGDCHRFTASGAFVAGFANNVAGNWSSVSGGDQSTASGLVSSVSGGDRNEASGDYSSVSGGDRNVASNTSASVSGGDQNSASNFASSVSGGTGNKATGPYSSVTGGEFNTSVSGTSGSVGIAGGYGFTE